MNETLSEVPTRLEEYRIASRRLTPGELEAAAREVGKCAEVWREDKRGWPNFDQFLGWQIAKQAFYWQVKPDQMDEFIRLANERTQWIRDAEREDGE